MRLVEEEEKERCVTKAALLNRGVDGMHVGDRKKMNRRIDVRK